MKRSGVRSLLGLSLLLFGEAPSEEARTPSAPAPGTAKGVILPRPSYENILCFHYSGGETDTLRGAFPDRLYVAADSSNGFNHDITSPYFPRWYTWVGTHRYPTEVPKVVDASGDLRTAVWPIQGDVAYAGAIPAYKYKYKSCFSQYSRRFWDETRKIFLEKAKRKAPWGDWTVITACDEVELNSRANGCDDFSPWTVKEFRDYLTHRGIYGKEYSKDYGLRGPLSGYPGGEAFADDPTPARAKGKNKTFNEVFGTRFTTWDLKYWDPDRFPEKVPLDADPRPKKGEKGHTDGGFEPPVECKGPADPYYSAWANPDPDRPGFLEQMIHRCVDGVLRILNEDCGVDRTFIVSHQWVGLANSAKQWIQGQKGWEQGYNSRAHWTAVTRHARSGVSGSAGVRDFEMWEDMERLSAELSLAEMYMFGGERDLHSREEYMSTLDAVRRFHIHQTNGIWEQPTWDKGIWKTQGRADPHGTANAPGEDALYLFFREYPDLPFHQKEPVDYVPPGVCGVQEQREEARVVLRWSGKIWDDRHFSWEAWRDWKEFEVGMESAGEAQVIGRTLESGFAWTIPQEGTGRDARFGVRAVSAAGKAGAWSWAGPWREPPAPAGGAPLRNGRPAVLRAQARTPEALAAAVLDTKGPYQQRRHAVWDLVRSGDPKASGVLLGVLSDPSEDPMVRIGCLGGLQHLKASELGGILMAVLKEKDAAKPADEKAKPYTGIQLVRRDAAAALGRIGHKEAEKDLLGLLVDPREDPLVRTFAAESLCRLGTAPERYEKALAQLHGDCFAIKGYLEIEQAIWNLADLMGGLKRKAFVPALVAAVETETNQWLVERRSWAARALGAIAREGDVKAEGCLAAMAKKGHADLYFHGHLVEESASTRRGESRGVALLKDRKANPVLRWRAARGLAKGAKPNGQLSALVEEILKEEQEDVPLRMECVRILGRYGNKGHLEVLGRILAEEGAWPELRELCARALGDLGSRWEDPQGAARACLRAFEAKNDRGIRYWAGDALNRILGLGLSLDEAAMEDTLQAFRKTLGDPPPAK